MANAKCQNTQYSRPKLDCSNFCKYFGKHRPCQTQSRLAARILRLLPQILWRQKSWTPPCMMTKANICGYPSKKRVSIPPMSPNCCPNGRTLRHRVCIILAGEAQRRLQHNGIDSLIMEQRQK